MWTGKSICVRWAHHVGFVDALTAQSTRSSLRFCVPLFFSHGKSVCALLVEARLFRFFLTVTSLCSPCDEIDEVTSAGVCQGVFVHVIAKSGRLSE